MNTLRSHLRAINIDATSKKAKPNLQKEKYI